jgi:hypothetical protein
VFPLLVTSLRICMLAPGTPAALFHVVEEGTRIIKVGQLVPLTSGGVCTRLLVRDPCP